MEILPDSAPEEDLDLRSVWRRLRDLRLRRVEIPDEAWRTKLAILEPLSSFATAYRYPSPTGQTKPGPSTAEIMEWLGKLRDLEVEIRALIGQQPD